jgi:hypothetical protein
MMNNFISSNVSAEKAAGAQSEEQNKKKINKRMLDRTVTNSKHVEKVKAETIGYSCKICDEWRLSLQALGTHIGLKHKKESGDAN